MNNSVDSCEEEDDIRELYLHTELSEICRLFVRLG